MTPHGRRFIKRTYRGGNTDHQAQCNCGQEYFGSKWSDAETGIDRHIKAENDRLYLQVANELFHVVTPSEGHVGNQSDEISTQYLTLAEYVTNRGFQ
ncbi:hypothetical protein [Rhodococcoides fascians]|uniref:hypothetical protein n=1 Tax=Rhodococcoides fascians TaxID=1828 RepID=UPI00055A8C14|nr:hypothetical protein [Rhodococcus fascians]